VTDETRSQPLVDAAAVGLTAAGLFLLIRWLLGKDRRPGDRPIIMTGGSLCVHTQGSDLPAPRQVGPHKYEYTYNQPRPMRRLKLKFRDGSYTYTYTYEKPQSVVVQFSSGNDVVTIEQGKITIDGDSATGNDPLIREGLQPVEDPDSDVGATVAAYRHRLPAGTVASVKVWGYLKVTLPTDIRPPRMKISL
jgi:hypothetical protein